MHIGLVGGIDRNAHHYVEMAKAEGHSVECHTGHLAGRGVDTLTAMIDRSDLVVVITDVNSHGGMWSARRISRARGRRCVLVRRLGASRFRELLGELEGAAEPLCRAVSA